MFSIKFPVKFGPVLVIGLLYMSAAVSETLDCSGVAQYIPHVDINYAEDDAGLRYELAWGSEGYYWSGTAFEFWRPFEENALLIGIASDESTLTSAVVENFQGLLLDMGIHPELTVPTVSETVIGDVITFKAADDAFPSAYGFYARQAGEGGQVFRVSGVPQGESPPVPSDRATVKAVIQLIKGCISDAA